MLIGIDCRLWSQTGVGRYIRNLVLNLSKIDLRNDYIIFIGRKDSQDLWYQVPNLKWKIVETEIKWHTLSEQTSFARLLNSYNLDLVHFPYFSVPYFYRKNYIVTVHDLINNKLNTGKASTLPYPVYAVKKIGYKIVLSNALNKSKKIIVPSESVKDDLLQIYSKIPQEKVAVTYEGGFENIRKISKRIVKEEYFLRIGNFYPHKNLDTLLSAFAMLLKEEKYNSIKLVLVGKKDFFYTFIEEKISSLGIYKNIVFFENPTDSDLISLYSNSIATVIPSYMEGFSLTAVESMSLGTPVLASDIPVHRVICGDSAIFFDPKNFEELTEKMKLITNFSETKRKDLIKSGMAYAKKFSWEKMANETLKIYESSTSLRQG